MRAGNSLDTRDDAVNYLNGIIRSGYEYLAFFTADLFTGSRDMTNHLLLDVLPQVRRDLGVAVQANA